MDRFEYKSFREKHYMSMRELARYHARLRKYEYDAGIPLKGMKWREAVHPLVVMILRLDRIISKDKIFVMNDAREIGTTKKPVIYACTHNGGNDVLRIAEAIKDHTYIFYGDPAPVYKDPIFSKVLFLNGSIDLELKDKEDRQIAFKRAIELLEKGGSLIVFPEGAWNVTPNLPMGKIFKGTAKMAIEAGVDIIPVAIEQYGHDFIISIGKNLKTSSGMDSTNLTEQLRDTLATMKYLIWETQPPLLRTPSQNAYLWEGASVSERLALLKRYDEAFGQSIVDLRPGYGTLEEVYEARYHDPNDVNALEIIRDIERKMRKPDGSMTE